MPRQKLEQVHLALGVSAFLAMRRLLTANRLAHSLPLVVLPMPPIHQHWLQLLPEHLGKFCNQMGQVRHLGWLCLPLPHFQQLLARLHLTQTERGLTLTAQHHLYETPKMFLQWLETQLVDTQ